MVQIQPNQSVDDCIVVLAANVTYWTTKVRDWLRHRNWHVALLTEVHWHPDSLHGHIKELLHDNFIPTFSTPRLSDDSPAHTYGGSLVLRHKHIQGSPLAEDRPFPRHMAVDQELLHTTRRHQAWEMPFHNLAGQELHLKGATILLLSSYHRGGLDWDVLGTVAAITRGGVLPFILYGDFNVPPQTLIESGFPDTINAAVMHTGQTTCKVGKACSNIDYFLVSKPLVSLIAHIKVHMRPPFGPHFALELALRRSAKQLHVWAAREVRRWPVLPKHHLRAAAHRSPGLPPLAHRHLSGTIGTTLPHQQRELGQRLVAVVGAAESTTLSAVRVPKGQEASYRGRARQPRYQRVPLMRLRKGGSDLDALTAQAAPCNMGTTSRLLYSISRMAQHIISNDSIKPAYWAYQLSSLLHEEERAWLQVEEDLEREEYLRLQRDIHMAIASAFAGDHRVHFLAARASGLSRKYQDKQRATWRKAWEHRMIQSASDTKSACFQWLRSHESQQVDLVQLTTDDPQHVPDLLANKWSVVWQCHDRRRRKHALDEIRQLRMMCFPLCPAMVKVVTELFQPEPFRRAVKSFCRRTAIGSDQVVFHWLVELPDAALDDLGQIFYMCFINLALPDTLLDHYLSAIPKKEPGTHRLIVVLASMLRLLLGMLTRTFVRPWDAEYSSPHDTAAPGKRADVMVGLRHALQAADRILGLHTAMVLWDLEAFYDNVDVPTLIRQCRRWHFPLPVLALALQCHMAPRRIRCGKGVSRALRPARGILAGCSTSTSCSRAQLRNAASDQVVDTHQHVDDMAMLHSAPTKRILFKKIKQAAGRFTERVRWLRLTVSRPSKGARPKTKVLSSCPRVGRAIVRELARLQVQAEYVRSADDLGIGTSGGPRRTMTTMQRRQATGMARARRLRILAALTMRARTMYIPGVRSVQLYGHFAQGLTPSQMVALRRAALVAMGLPTAVPNAHALFALLDQTDPVVHIATQQLFMWLLIWNAASTIQREQLAQAWRIVAPRISNQPSNTRWRSAADPMTATITTLLDWGFDPCRPDHWKHGEHSLRMDGPPEVRGAAYRIVKDVCARRMWTLDHGPASEGLEYGPPSLIPAQQVAKQLKKESRFEELRILYKVVTGAYWKTSQLCPHCSCPETPEHKYYGCDYLDRYEDPHQHILKTRGTRPQQGAGCLYYRGLVPWRDWHRPCEPQAVQTDNYTNMLATANIVAGDGGGAPPGVPKPAQRVATGMALLRVHNNQLLEWAVAAYTVPGRQTVPRAELQGLVKAGQATLATEYLSDASYVVAGPSSSLFRQSSYLASVNGDLWQQYFLQSEHARKTPIKVKAHRSAVQAARDGDFWAFVANCFADAAAGIGAALFRDEDYEKLLAANFPLTTSLIWRIIAIELARQRQLPERVPQPQLPALPLLLSEGQAHADHLRSFLHAGHVITTSRFGAKCSRCLEQVPWAKIEDLGQPCVAGRIKTPLTNPPRVRLYRVQGKQKPEQLLTPHRRVPPYVRWQTASKLRRAHYKQRAQIQAANASQSHRSARTAACTLARTVAGLSATGGPLAPVIPSWVNCPRKGVHPTHTLRYVGGAFHCPKCHGVTPAPTGRSKLNCQKQCRARPTDIDPNNASERHSRNKNDKLFQGIWHRDAGARGWPDTQGGKDTRTPIPLFWNGEVWTPFTQALSTQPPQTDADTSGSAVTALSSSSQPQWLPVRRTPRQARLRAVAADLHPYQQFREAARCGQHASDTEYAD